jgi:hypothetical protein
MLKTIFIIIVLYFLLSGKYKNYITIKTPIPLISKFGENQQNYVDVKTIKLTNGSGIPLKTVDTYTNIFPPFFIDPGQTLDFTVSRKGNIKVIKQSGEIYKIINGESIKNNSTIVV